MLYRLPEVLKSLGEHNVRYVAIGGIAAVAYGVPRVTYGVPRVTYDLDILIDPTPGNADRLLRALESAGVMTATLTTVDRLLKHEVTVFDDIVRIDVQTRTPGITFSEAWEQRVTDRMGGQPIHIISREHLIASNQAAGRPIDLEDVRLLELPSEDESDTDDDRAGRRE